MSYRRDVFKKRASEFLRVTIEELTVLNLEKGVFNNSIDYCKNNNFPLKWSDINFCKHYSTNARRVLANISYTMNATVLKLKIYSGEIDVYNLVKLTKEQMNPTLWESLKIKTLQQIPIQKEELADGIFKCNKCKSMKTSYYQMQTRSADEPMTTYVTCLNCSLKWKC